MTTSNQMTEEEPLDVMFYFADLGPGDKPERPDDYVGPEIQASKADGSVGFGLDPTMPSSPLRCNRQRHDLVITEQPIWPLHFRRMGYADLTDTASAPLSAIGRPSVGTSLPTSPRC